MSNIQVVQSIYEAFGRGDVPAILERLHPEVEWEYDAVDHGVPWLVPRRGRAEVVKFFESLQGVEFHRFEPANFLEGSNQVLATIHLDITVRASGKKVVDLEAHLFTFDSAGKVTRFQHLLDSHQHVLAIRS
jgi:uncharacterized protein